MNTGIALAVGLLLVGLVGLAVGLVLGLAWRRRHPPAAVPPPGSGPAGVGTAPTAGVRPPSREPGPSPRLSSSVLDVLRSGAAVVDASDQVVLANPAAHTMGVVRDGRLPAATLRELVRVTRRDGRTREVEVDLPQVRLGREPAAVRVRVAPAGEFGHVALLVEDITEARRVEATRRDFVANVSHELKTPVGALALLAEALQEASDDPEAVQRFSQRMLHEASRLSNLIRDLIELSRLQGADPLPEPARVEVDTVVAEAVDAVGLVAAAGEICLATGGERGCVVLGSERQLVTALVNLLTNAVNYSSPGTRVALGVRERSGQVEIAVRDEGMGIAETDLDRIFERFYRADPARSRSTGGTGLGLALVKHIATNHGGSVDVWSVEGSGSTFTLRLPTAPLPPPASYDEQRTHIVEAVR